MGPDLPSVLALLYDSSRRWRTLRAEGEEWRDEERSLEAFSRRRPPGAISTRRGAPGPADRDPRWRLWVRQPHEVRVEFDGGHRTPITQISDATRMWMTLPDGRSQVHERPGGARFELGPAAVLVETRSMFAAFDFDVTGPATVLDRAAVAVRARPQEDAARHGFGVFHPFLHGADEVQVAVDAERGIILQLEALLGDVSFYRVGMTTVAFDEELSDEIFAIPAEHDPGLDAPLAGRATAAGPRRRRPVMRHEGPPDDVVGHPTNLHTVLVRTDTVFVIVDRVVAYPAGFELYVTVGTRDEQLSGTTEPAHPRSWGGTAAFPGESLRFGVAFSDGRRSFTDNSQRTPPSDLTLVPISGSGTAARFDQRFWVGSLPPPGPLGFIVEWAPRGVPETRVDVPADAILEAASRAIVIWGTEPD